MIRSCPYRFRTLLACATLLFLWPDGALADQFTLMDVEFTFTHEDALNSSPSPSHYYVKSDKLGAQQPTNWNSPVDYRNGSVHIRTEVKSKPKGSAVTQWSLCYIPHVGIGQGYGCANSGTYTEEGVHEVDSAMTEWWANDQIDWNSGIKEMHLVIKNEDSGMGHAHNDPNPEEYFPTTVRITMVQVSAGATYDPASVPELMSSGSGGEKGATPDQPKEKGGCSIKGGRNAPTFPWVLGILTAGLFFRRQRRRTSNVSVS